MKTENITTLHLTTSRGRSPLRLAFLLIPLALGCFALSQTARAVSPAPDGAYPFANTAEGSGALQNLTTGVWNTANGSQTLFHDTTGGQNIAIGVQALFTNTTGGTNVATGIQALYSNTTGGNNTATGFQALLTNTTGTNNTAFGGLALAHNTIISNNTAVGWKALQFSNPPTGDSPNTAVGSLALLNNTTGDGNTAVGFKALLSNTNGPVNTAFGQEALASNTLGDSNNATGFQALFSNTTGVWNEAYGFFALSSNVSGRENTAIGDSAGNAITGSFNINIGSAVTGGAGENSTTRIGLATAVGSTPAQTACFIGGISGVTIPGGVPVVVASNGQLGIAATSSQRFKDEIKPMDKASEAVLALKPVTFHYKKEIDPKGIPQFGLVAEDVTKVNPDLVTRDAKGQLYTVRYEAVNAMLLNEFLKEHHKVTELEATVAKQQRDFRATAAQQQKQIEALTAGLQKVSAQVEMNRPAPQVVNNNQ